MLLLQPMRAAMQCAAHALHRQTRVKFSLALPSTQCASALQQAADQTPPGACRLQLLHTPTTKRHAPCCMDATRVQAGVSTGAPTMARTVNALCPQVQTGVPPGALTTMRRAPCCAQPPSSDRRTPGALASAGVPRALGRLWQLAVMRLLHLLAQVYQYRLHGLLPRPVSKRVEVAGVHLHCQKLSAA